MASEVEELTDPPNAIDPYAVLSVAKDATSDQIKSAYRKAALRHHPGTRVVALSGINGHSKANSTQIRPHQTSARRRITNSKK